MTNPHRLELDIERTVAGGRSLARHEGQVVLVSGAIAGERVVAEVERAQRGVLFARTVEVLRADPARRDPGPDPACGGMTFAHVSPERQRELKAEIVADAFARIAKMPVPAPVFVHASPEAAYRMRARVHLRGGRIGSFREGTHDVCPVALTRQVSERVCGCRGARGAVPSRARHDATGIHRTRGEPRWFRARGAPRARERGGAAHESPERTVGVRRDHRSQRGRRMGAEDRLGVGRAVGVGSGECLRGPRRTCAGRGADAPPPSRARLLPGEPFPRADARRLRSRRGSTTVPSSTSMRAWACLPSRLPRAAATPSLRSRAIR